MSIIIKYAEKVYKNKVEELQGYIDSLDNHLKNLEGYRDEINEYWKDKEGLRYYNLVSQEIRAVKTARKRADSLQKIYENARRELNKSNISVSDLLGDATSIVNNLGIK